MPLIRSKTDQLHPDTGQPIHHYLQVATDGRQLSELTEAELRDPKLCPPVVMTGPIKGSLTLTDGTAYNVSDDYIEVASMEHAGELKHHIAVTHEHDGHEQHLSRDHADYDPLVDEYHHICTDHCGVAFRTPKQQTAEFAARLADLGQGHLVGTPEHADVISRLSAAAALHAPTKDGAL